jgi:uncharacterized protein YlxW (UPF0749 family)
MFKKEVETLQSQIPDYERKLKELISQIHTRDAEIQRLGALYQGG